MSENSPYVAVRTQTGTQNHKARRGVLTVTLCGYSVGTRGRGLKKRRLVRVGTSWAPEFPREWDHQDECSRCEKAAGTGGLP